MRTKLICQLWGWFDLPSKGVTSPLWPEARVDKAGLCPDDDEDDDNDDEDDDDEEEEAGTFTNDD